jgi:hypothetical protein
MSPYPTDLYVVSQSARELVVVDPPYTGVSTVFVAVGIFAIAICIVLLIQFRVGLVRPYQAVLWLGSFAIGAPFLGVAAFTGRTTHISLSADSSTLSVQKSLLSMPFGLKNYPLAQVRLVKVGVGDGCRFLYVSLVDQPAENLTNCTDRTGYSEAAEAMNAFLDANRNAGPQRPQGLTQLIP